MCYLPRTGSLFLGTLAILLAFASYAQAAPKVQTFALRVSRPAELHRRPLVEPSVRLSPHSAPIRQTCRSSRVASERRDPRAP
jgi:hypothetical protein